MAKATTPVFPTYEKAMLKKRALERLGYAVSHPFQTAMHFSICQRGSSGEMDSREWMLTVVR